MSKALDIIHDIAVQVADINNAVFWYAEFFSCGIKYQGDDGNPIEILSTLSGR